MYGSESTAVDSRALTTSLPLRGPAKNWQDPHARDRVVGTNTACPPSVVCAIRAPCLEHNSPSPKTQSHWKQSIEADLGEEIVPAGWSHPSGLWARVDAMLTGLRPPPERGPLWASLNIWNK